MEAVQTLQGWRKGTAGSRALADCCLVVPTYRRAERMVTLLQRVAALPDPPAEVVVVDGSPDTATGEAVGAWVRGAELPFELRYVSSPAGLTRQRNVGVDVSTKEMVFFLDDDCLPQPNYFRGILDVFAADTAHKIGAVCGSIVNEMNQPMPVRWKWRFRLGLVPRGEPGRYYPMATSVPRSTVAMFQGTRPVDIVPGGATGYRRAVFSRQRFSMFFDGYSQGEDLEMSLRIGRDWKLLWSGDAHCVHHHAAEGRPASYRKGRMEVRNRYFIWRRHTPHPGCLNRIRLWGDFLYIFLYDLVSAIVYPRQGGDYAGHAAGVVSGALSCLVSPPRHEEPPVRREYEVDFAEWRGD